MKEKKLYEIWWVWLIAILIGFLIALVIVDINWLTHTKYKLDPLYCENNKECTLDSQCNPINIYALGDNSKGDCLRTIKHCGEFACGKTTWSMKDAEE